jgi:crotonobetaine/carnitine-CoA ligase
MIDGAELLFVYGTLRAGTGHPKQTLLARGADYVGRARFGGRLHRVAHYPGLVETDVPSEFVVGDVFRLRDPATLLRELDAYEGCHPDDPAAPYARVRREVRLEAGGTVTAWLYLYNRSIDTLERIESGDFLAAPRPRCITRDLLIEAAAAHPDRELFLFDDGQRWTYADTLARVRKVAAGLDAMGVRQGETVLSWQGNGPMAVTSFLALNYLGAVYVPINTGYRGALLAHLIGNSGATLMLADGRLLERLAGIDTAALSRIVVIGDERPDLGTPELLPASSLTSAGDSPPMPTIAPWNTQMVIYTSGTTGPSKGVLSSYRHAFTAARGFRNVGPGDRNLMQLPMFHVGGTYAVLWAIMYGGSSVVVEAFSVSRFWEIIRRFEVTTVGLLGTMAQFLLRQPESPYDKQHSLRSVIIAPFDDAAIAFGQRFGVPTFTEFNMTELAVPLWAGPDPRPAGTCGRRQAGAELRLVDADDQDVPLGTPGELIVRPAEAWTISHGYLNDAEATARTWRDGWFRTGDLLRRDADDNYFFVDRKKDAIRRRGENISSYEVERAILEHAQVREAAVVAVPADESEDEVLAAIALKPGGALDPAELIDFLRDRLAYFMIPRYLRLLDELPKTPTQKVEKRMLRDAGVTSDTWDRVAAGIDVGRDRLSAR